MYASKKNLFTFTKLMSELLNSGLSISSSLKIISSMKGVNVTVKKTALEINSALEKGYDFCEAIKFSSNISFPDYYVSFVKASVEGGRLDKTFSFLLEKEESGQELRKKIFMTSIYPFFVLLFAIAGSLLLYSFGDKLAIDLSGTFDKAAYKKNSGLACFEANAFLFFVICFFIFLLKKFFCENQRLDFFNIISFMTSSGIDLFSALKISLPLAEKNEKLKKQILLSLVELERGMGAAFVLKKFGMEYEAIFEVAESSGSINEAFKQIVCLLKKKKCDREKLLETLLEPCLMCVLAIYLVILILKVLGPVMFSYGI